MSTPQVRELEYDIAPAPVRRQKPNLLKRHWLSGAFMFGLVGISAYTGVFLYRVEQRLNAATAVRQEVESELDSARRANADLQTELKRVTSDEYMELSAKKQGFVYPNEKVSQAGTSQE